MKEPDVCGTILITGAGRGIGLALTRRFLDGGFRVLACLRHPRKSDELRELHALSKGLRIFRLDVSHPAEIRSLAARLSGESIDILLNNAGVYGPQTQGLETVPDNMRSWSDTFSVNVAGPFFVCRAFTDHVARSSSRVMATIGSQLGSISDANSGEPYIYRASKAAVHMTMKGLHQELSTRGIISVAFHPGWVRTAMGGPDAPMEPSESADGLFQVLTSLKADDSGRLLNYKGEIIPW